MGRCIKSGALVWRPHVLGLKLGMLSWNTALSDVSLAQLSGLYCPESLSSELCHLMPSNNYWLLLPPVQAVH